MNEKKEEERGPDCGPYDRAQPVPVPAYIRNRTEVKEESKDDTYVEDIPILDDRIYIKEELSLVDHHIEESCLNHEEELEFNHKKEDNSHNEMTDLRKTESKEPGHQCSAIGDISKQPTRTEQATNFAAERESDELHQGIIITKTWTQFRDKRHKVCKKLKTPEAEIRSDKTSPRLKRMKFPCKDYNNKYNLFNNELTSEDADGDRQISSTRNEFQRKRRTRQFSRLVSPQILQKNKQQSCSNNNHYEQKLPSKSRLPLITDKNLQPVVKLTSINKFHHKNVRHTLHSSRQASPQIFKKNNQHPCPNNNHSEQEHPSNSCVSLTTKKSEQLIDQTSHNNVFTIPTKPPLNSKIQRNQCEPQVKDIANRNLQEVKLNTSSLSKERAVQSDKEMAQESQKNFFGYLKTLTKEFNRSQMLNFSSKVLQLVAEIKSEQLKNK